MSSWLHEVTRSLDPSLRLTQVRARQKTIHPQHHPSQFSSDKRLFKRKELGQTRDEEQIFRREVFFIFLSFFQMLDNLANECEEAWADKHFIQKIKELKFDMVV